VKTGAQAETLHDALPFICGLTVLAGVWLKAKEIEISDVLWPWAWEKLFIWNMKKERNITSCK